MGSGALLQQVLSAPARREVDVPDWIIIDFS